MAERLRGTIRKIVADKGFGFLQVESGPDHFFHIRDSEFVNGDFNDALLGTPVEFTPALPRAGGKSPQATDVRVVT
jgi:cold shock CspA family protein